MSRTHRSRRTRRRPAPANDWTVCPKSGKRGYQSKHAALIGATTLPTTFVDVYVCPDCSRWHVTTSRPGRRLRPVQGKAPRRKEDMSEKTKNKVLDPTRSEERDAVEALDAKPKVVKGFEIVKYSGERTYFSNDKADAEERLVGLAAVTDGIGGKEGNGEPTYTLRECSYVEVEGFDPEGPESRTRGKHDGSPAEGEDADA